MEQLLAEVLLSCADQMARREGTLNRYTSETCQHELNLAFQFATEARLWFPWLDCDFDVAKRNLDWKRPDVIFHRRGRHEANFLVIEIKRTYNSRGAAEDIQKIRTDWFSDRLRYRFGASLLLRDNEHPLEVFVISRAPIGPPTRVSASGHIARCSPHSDNCEIVAEMKNLVRRVVEDRSIHQTVESEAERGLDSKIKEFFRRAEQT